MGNLRVGDQVFDETGAPCRVTFVTEVMTEHVCYEVCFDDGTSIVADVDHKWSVHDDVRERDRVLTTGDMVDKVKYGKRLHRNRFAITNQGAIKTTRKSLPIDPYVLGVWLGDGHNYSNWVYLNADDKEIIDRIIAKGYLTDVVRQGDSNCNIVKVHSPLLDSFRSELKSLGLLSGRHGHTGKFIPTEYLRASVEQRMELLRGLMDTDGYVCNRGRLEIVTVHERLKDNLCELIASLGFKVSVDEGYPTFNYKGETRTGQKTYTLHFFAYKDNSPFYLQRQVAKLKAREHGRPTQTGRRRIVDIRKVNSVPVCCIQVNSPNHLYLAGRQMVPTHNTDALLLNWLTYSVRCDPMDLIMYSPSMAAARDFSMRRVDRLHRHSPAIGELLRGDREADNKFDKHYANGMMLSLSWPSSTEMAGKPIPRVALTDYDRMDDDVDGEGSPFDLASKRTTTFGSFAMTLAESSPSRPLEDPRWIAQSPHEAPPTTGILALYNRGDRRRRYWPCPHCSQYFEGTFSMLKWDDKGDHLSSAETVRMECPKCGKDIYPSERHEMQQWAIWLKDGEAIDKQGRRYGTPVRSSIASFWLNGVAASFTTWKKLVETYLTAEDEYQKTGNEEPLKKFYNTDLSEVYIPKSMEHERIPEHLKARSEKFCEEDERVVPEGVRFIVATVDVQKNMFVVQVQGIAPGNPFDMVLIDRYDVRKSKRTDEDGDTLWIKPGSYLEDWDELIEHVMDRSYPLQGDPTRRMAVKLTLCDSGGKEGVTTNAYAFYRKLRNENLHGRFHLVKGDPSPKNPRTRVSFPDAQQKDKLAAARGDVPVLLLNSNMLKDALSNRLDCLEPGKGMYRFPDWAPDWWYREMCSEVRTPKGWENPSHSRNEAWDLSYYCIGGCVSKLLRLEHIDWSNPPGWCADWDKNDLIHQANSPKKFAQDRNVVYSFAQFAEKLA